MNYRTIQNSPVYAREKGSGLRFRQRQDFAFSVPCNGYGAITVPAGRKLGEDQMNYGICMENGYAFLRVKLNLLPFPASLSTCTLLSCASMICLTMESPKPVPPNSLERLLSTV
jgi:hypothetical protein